MTGDKRSDSPSIEVLVAEGPARLELHADGVAHVRLNRPEASNGLDMELLKALHEVLMQVHGEGRVRAVLLTGEGKYVDDLVEPGMLYVALAREQRGILQPEHRIAQDRPRTSHIASPLVVPGRTLRRSGRRSRSASRSVPPNQVPQNVW